ncbi:MAG: 30S ribosomal protein S4 [Candidatus Azambacteria bacterium]|nr:30S ribosomal protein S4 [Candidatus Azambacteria bacterium]
MRYTGPKEKLSRKVGENLGLKAERSFSPKSSFMKKPYRPGQHGKARRRALSEFGTQMIEKQKLRFIYGLTEKQLKKYFNETKKRKGLTGNILLSILEKRLDNTVFKAGLALSRAIARQLTSHGHFLVNDKRINIPSYQVNVADTISIRPQSKLKLIFGGLDIRLKKHDAPSWLEVDKKTFEIKIKSEPKDDDLPKNLNMNAIVEYYSR